MYTPFTLWNFLEKTGRVDPGDGKYFPYPGELDESLSSLQKKIRSLGYPAEISDAPSPSPRGKGVLVNFVGESVPDSLLKDLEDSGSFSFVDPGNPYETHRKFLISGGFLYGRSTSEDYPSYHPFSFFRPVNYLSKDSGLARMEFSSHEFMTLLDTLKESSPLLEDVLFSKLKFHFPHLEEKVPFDQFVFLPLGEKMPPKFSAAIIFKNGSAVAVDDRLSHETFLRNNPLAFKGLTSMAAAQKEHSLITYRKWTGVQEFVLPNVSRDLFDVAEKFCETNRLFNLRVPIQLNFLSSYIPPFTPKGGGFYSQFEVSKNESSPISESSYTVKDLLSPGYSNPTGGQKGHIYRKVVKAVEELGARYVREENVRDERGNRVIAFSGRLFVWGGERSEIVPEVIDKLSPLVRRFTPSKFEEEAGVFIFRGVVFQYRIPLPSKTLIVDYPDLQISILYDYAPRFSEFTNSHLSAHEFLELSRSLKEAFDPRNSSRPPEYSEVSASVRNLIRSHSICTRMSVESLEEVIRSGEFLTYHDTGKSRTDWAHLRRDAEDFAFGAGSKPYYGYLSRRNERDSDMLDFYGEVRVTFKNSIRPFCTFTEGDSLPHLRDGAVHPAPLENPHTGAFVYSRDDPSSAFDDDFIEVQIHKELKLSDIEKLDFQRDDDLKLVISSLNSLRIPYGYF